MPTPTSLLDEALAAWAYTRASLIDEVENLPADEFDFRPAPEGRSVAELVRHTIESGLMMSGELPRPDGDFHRQSFDAFIQEYAADVSGATGRAELLDLLRSTHQTGDRKIRDAGEIFMLQLIRQFDGTRRIQGE